MTEPAPEPIVDTFVLPYADALLACLCRELADTIAGSPCLCCLRPGGTLPPMDACYCTCPDGNSGQASVQIGPITPTSKFPRGPVEEWIKPCASRMLWVAELTMVVYRCVSTVDDEGRPPTCAELDADSRKLASDMAAMLRAFGCCDWRGERAVVPVGYRPIPPAGGCAGGQFSLLLDLGAFCCPTGDS